MAFTSAYPGCIYCKTRHKYGTLWECLVDDPIVNCSYKLTFGYKKYCRHHKCHDFEDLRERKKRNEELV